MSDSLTSDAKDLGVLAVLVGGVVLLYLYRDQIKSFFGSVGGAAQAGNTVIERFIQGGDTLIDRTTDTINDVQRITSLTTVKYVNDLTPDNTPDTIRKIAQVAGNNPVMTWNDSPFFGGKTDITIQKINKLPSDYFISKEYTPHQDAVTIFDPVATASRVADPFVKLAVDTVGYWGGAASGSLWGLVGSLLGQKTSSGSGGGGSFLDLTPAEINAYSKSPSTRTSIDKMLINERNKQFAVDAAITSVPVSQEDGITIYQNYSAYLPDKQGSVLNNLTGQKISGDFDVLMSYLGRSADIRPGTVEYQTRITAGNQFLGLNLNATPDGINRLAPGGYTAAPNSFGVSANNQVWRSDARGLVSFVGRQYEDQGTAMANLADVLRPKGAAASNQGVGGGGFVNSDNIRYAGSAVSGGDAFGQGAMGSLGSAMESAMSSSMSSGMSYADALNDWASR